MFRKFLSAAFVLVLAKSTLAHELWIEPEAFQADSGERVNAALVNGQNFVGTSLVYSTRSIEELVVLQSGEPLEIASRLGDRPAIQFKTESSGLAILGYHSKPLRITYSDWAKFEAFANEKGLRDPVQVHQNMGISTEKFHEAYTRFSKSLIAIGTGEGSDAPLGFEAELVALENPYQNSSTTAVSVQLLYQSLPRPHSQIDVFERAPNGDVSKIVLHTDEHGVANIPVQASHDYMLDAVIFREPSNDLKGQMDVQWETLWANLTFSIPR